MNLLWLYIFLYKNNNPQANTFFFNLHIYFIQAHYQCGLLQINTGNTFSRASIRCLSNLFSVLNLWKKNCIQTIRLKKKVNAFILYDYFCQFSRVFFAMCNVFYEVAKNDHKNFHEKKPPQNVFLQDVKSNCNSLSFTIFWLITHWSMLP